MVLFVLSLLGYSALTFFLFYRQCIVYGGLYNSDMLSYIATIKGESTEYNFPYPLMFKSSEFLSHFCQTEVALSIVVTLLNALSFALLIYYIRPFVKKALDGKKGIVIDLATCVAALTLLLVSMLFLPGSPTVFGHSFEKRVVGVFSPNPYWNATYLSTRPFTIVNFWSACKMLDTYERRAELKDYFIFGISLLLTTLTKPSYTLVAVFVFIIIFIYRLIKSRFKNFSKTILFGLTFLPAGFDCIYQYLGVFTGTNSYGEETGIGIALGKAWHTGTDNIPMSIFLAGGFALWMLIINFNRLKDTTWFRYAWQYYAVSLVMFLLLYEKGFRLFHCNFAWGYVHGLFFGMMVGLIMLIINTKEAKTAWNKLLVTIGWIAYASHLFCGVKFFIYLLVGGDFFKY